MPPHDRRTFLSASAASAGSLAFLSQLPAVSAADTKHDPNLVRLDSGIEPLVRLLEETSRDRLLEEVGLRIQKGLAYREVLAALLLAGVRNVQPRPSVGFKFHAVLVVNSAHQSAMAGPDNERWLPIFWALDNFKSAQAQNLKESGWRMKSVDDAQVPDAPHARERFLRAMDEWDVEAADRAVTGLVRTATAGELFDLFARYGSRDFRDIGHKIIYVANAFRTLEVIGWHHAEPVLRSLAYALLKHDGKNPAKEDLDADRPGRLNSELLRKVRPGWTAGSPVPEESATIIEMLREATATTAAETVIEQLRQKIAPQSVWDGLFLGAGELLMRQPGIVGLHTLTTLNALRYAYRTTGSDELRRFLLLQAASFLPLFREAMKARGALGDARITRIEAADITAVPLDAGAVFAKLSKDKAAAARMALAYLSTHSEAERELIDTGRRLIFLKGTDSHDYKFSASVMEDAAALSPKWRHSFLAASLFWLKGSGAPESPLVKRTRSALA